MFKKAVLIIHGFAGGTYDEENLANYLELDKNYKVFQFTLPGHDKNLSKATYPEWIKKSEDMMDTLIHHGYHNICVIGHSMGGVIATYIAAKYKEVTRLVLASPAFHYLDIKDKKIDIKESIKLTPGIVKTYGKEEILARILKLDISTVKEFMNLVDEYYEYPKQVTCPVLLLKGKKDTVVPNSSITYVYDNVKSKIKKIVYIEDVTHDVFRNERDIEIFKLVDKFLKVPSNGVDTI